MRHTTLLQVDAAINLILGIRKIKFACARSNPALDTGCPSRRTEPAGRSCAFKKDGIEEINI